MRDLKNKLTLGKNTKHTQSRRGKSFGYQVLGFGSGGGASGFETNYLVVAGGAGAGIGGGGGGGAGGYRASGFGPAPLQGCALTVEAGCYSVTIGAGGAGAPQPGYDTGASPGGNSIFNPGGVEGCNMITGTGGGRSGGQGAPGVAGGSGGGGGAAGSTSGGSGNTPPFTPSQGNNGGNGTSPGGGGGGGGAGGAGNNGIGSGGSGAPNLINCGGTPFSITTFAGGGGGGSTANGGGGQPGGPGGGGAGGPSAANGTTNTGGGAGGRSNQAGGVPAFTPGANGGSGAVVLRFPAASTISVAPGTNAVATHPAGDKIATFTVTGTVSVS